MDGITISCIIPCSAKDFESEKLQDLISSIRNQEFPQDQIEILTVTEGDSESAKAIGIRRAKGEICAMFCADNMITDTNLFNDVQAHFDQFEFVNGLYPEQYTYTPTDNSLNRYFSLIGGNDPVCYYLGKNDRVPHVLTLERTSSYPKSYGCNGTFYRTAEIRKTDLDNYYPMDNAMEVGTVYPIPGDSIWHRTSDSFLTFLKKRYRYAKELYCDRGNRRWRMLDTREDYWKLLFFIVATLTIAEPISVSIRGFKHIRDWAWFWHPIVCWGFLITYGVLTLRTLFVRLLSQRWEDLNPFRPLSKA